MMSMSWRRRWLEVAIEKRGVTVARWWETGERRWAVKLPAEREELGTVSEAGC